MATDIFSSVGTTVSVSASAPATYDASGFAALTWTQCAEISDLPSFGTEAALATHTPLKTGVVAKRRGSLNYGSVGLTMAYSDADAGAAILRTAGDAAAGVNSFISFRITLKNGDIQYFQGQVMSYKTTVGNADGITMIECAVELDGSIVKVG